MSVYGHVGDPCLHCSIDTFTRVLDSLEYLAQLVLLLHLAAVVEVPQPGGHVQPAVQLLLWVALCRGQGGPADGELHARLLITHLLGGRGAQRRRVLSYS